MPKKVIVLKSSALLKKLAKEYGIKDIKNLEIRITGDELAKHFEQRKVATEKALKKHFDKHIPVPRKERTPSITGPTVKKEDFKFGGKDKYGFTYKASQHFAKRERTAKELRAARKALRQKEREADKYWKSGIGSFSKVERRHIKLAGQAEREADRLKAKVAKLEKEVKRLKKITKKIEKGGKQTYKNWRTATNPKLREKAKKKSREALDKERERVIDQATQKIMNELGCENIDELIDLLERFADGESSLLSSEEINLLREVVGMHGGRMTDSRGTAALYNYINSLKSKYGKD